MKLKYNYLIVLSLLTISLGSCGLKKSEAQEEREAWLESLNDSVSFYKMQIDDFNERLNMLHSEIGEMLDNFQHVSNPREVTGYYIYKGWKGKLPMDKSGLVARLNEDEKIELIATLIGGEFNQIEVSAAGEKIESEVVPHDQAFNYRTGSKNIVCFSDEKADSIAWFIRNHSLDKVTLTFLNSKKTGSIILPDDQKQMISSTWNLYDAQNEVKTLQRKVNVYSNAVNACRSLMDAYEKNKEK